MANTAQLHPGGGPRHSMDLFLHERGRALLETAAGTGLASLPLWNTPQFWAHFADGAVLVAHVVTAICGMLIAMHGVYRLFLKKNRRTGDKR